MKNFKQNGKLRILNFANGKDYDIDVTIKVKQAKIQNKSRTFTEIIFEI